MQDRGGSSFLSTAGFLILIPALLITLVLGFLLLRFVPRPTPPKTEATEVVVTLDTSVRGAKALIDAKFTDESAYLTLQVLDSKSKVVEGARVYDGWNYGDVLGTTSVNGMCVIPHEALAFENHSDLGTLRVEHDRFAPAVVRFPRHARRVEAVLSDMATLVVRIVDEESLPIAEATVELYEPDRVLTGGRWNRPLSTDAEGFLKVAGLRSGPYNIRACARGFVDGRTLAFADSRETAEARVVLKRGRVLDVRVLSSSGRPVVGSQVTLNHGQGFTGWSPNTGPVRNFWIEKTGMDGVATFESLPAVESRAYVNVEGPTHPPKLHVFEITGDLRSVDVIVEPAGTLVIDVVDAQGASIPCQVRIHGHRSGESQELMVEKPEGKPVRFTGLMTNHPLQCTVWRHNGVIHREDALTVGPDETREHTIRVPTQFRVRVSALDTAGSPVTGTVTLRRVKDTGAESVVYSAPVAGDGNATLSVLAGTYGATFKPKEGTKVEKQIVISGDSALAFEIPAGRTLKGLLVDPAGEPVPMVQVSWGASEVGSWTTVTAADGSFTLKRVYEGSGFLAVELQGFYMPVFRGPLPADGRFVAPIATIRGRVLLPDGRPTAALVQVQGGGNQQEATTRMGNVFGAGPDGTFRILVPAGRWTLWAWAGEFEASNIPVDVSSPGTSSMTTVTLSRP